MAVPTAQADSDPQDPQDPTTPKTVTADRLPTAQIDGVVWSQAVLGNRVYAGGSFSNARPAGAAAGVSTVARANMLAYDVQTGELISSFAPSFNAQVRTVVVSPDKSRIYVGGDFTTVNGQIRNRIAAFDATTGALLDSFKPPVNYHVHSIVATNTTVYAGGNFQGVGTRDRNGLAAFSASNGALLDWAPVAAGGYVWALAMSPDGSKIMAGGNFTTLNGSGNPGYGLGMIDAVTGASLPLAANATLRNGGTAAAITALRTDGDRVYGTGYVFGSGGNIEGVFSLDWNGGTVNWINSCHGDSYSVHTQGNAVYVAGHAHYCGNIGGFPQTEPNWSFYRAIAFGKTATGVNSREPYGGYANFQGQPSSSLLNWFPSMNAGTYTGQSQGPWNVTGNSDYIVMGGEFTKVNNAAQQGLVRYAVKEIAPNTEGPKLFSTTYPIKAVSSESGKVRITWGANHDPDNDYLTYKVYRDGQNGAGLVHTRSRRAPFWNLPMMGFTDSGLTPGSTHRYRVAVTDPAGNIANSPWVDVTVASTGTVSAYRNAVQNSEPDHYWRLGEPSGSTVVDSVGSTDATAGSGVTRGAVGAISGDTDTAATFNGTTSGFASTSKSVTPPNVFTLESWFKTTSTTGGKLIGFGNKTSGSSSAYDRHVYLDNAGRVNFGVYPGSAKVISSPKAYRDGQWHQATATLGSGGMKLYVDGERVAQDTTVTVGRNGFWGYWRIGGDNLSSWPSAPSSAYFNGSIDDVAVYKSVLTDSEVATHYAAATGTPAPNVKPVAAFTSVVDDLKVTVNGSGSTDSDGTVVSHAWTFGDGGTAATATASHTYAAAGTYDVKLTVTDDDGATDTLTKQVTVTAPAPNVKPVAAFTSSVDDLKVTVDGSGSTDSDGSVVSHAWTFGDGGTASTATASHTYAAAGTYDVKLTVTDDDGATDTLTKQVTVTAPAPNVKPVAAFTSSVDDLKVTVDGSGSTDSDGTVASYAWTFGDGGTASTATASHTYAAAGTYDVKLTVTDDDGATDTLTKQVTVSDPPAEPVPFAVDAFGRTVANGLGTADKGGAWTLTGSSANYSVGGGVAAVRSSSAGSGRSAYLNGVSSTDTDMLAQAALDKPATGGGVYVTVIGRRVGTVGGYNTTLLYRSDGTVSVSLRRVVGSTETALTTQTLPGVTVAAGDKLQVRMQVTGTSPTTLRTKVWKVGTTEPATWQLTTSDTTSTLQTGGGLGLETYLSGSATNAPLVVSFDNLEAKPTN